VQHRTSLIRSAGLMFTVFPTKIFYSADREESIVLYYRGNNNSIIGFWVSYIYICTTREYLLVFRANGGGPFACFGFRSKFLSALRSRLLLYMYVFFDMKVCCVSLFFNLDFCVLFDRIIIIGTFI